MYIKLNEIWYKYCPDRTGKYKYITYNLRTPETEPTIDEVAYADKIEVETWHDLYKKTGYCPVKVNITENDVWVSPWGAYFIGTGHGYKAERICDILFGLDYDITKAEDYLITHGWKKCTTSWMRDYYIKDNHYSNCTPMQQKAIIAWDIEHKLELTNFEE